MNRNILKWTHQMVECYKNPSCKDCFIKKMIAESNKKCPPDFYQQRLNKCRMREVIIETIKEIGLPPKELLEKYV